MADETLKLAGDTADTLPFSLHLELTVQDRETIEALSRYPEGPPRDEFARTALKIGVAALRHASGQLDGDFIRHETARLLEGMQTQLDQHARLSQERLAGALKEYFDPESGRFPERVERLVKRDGELEQVLQRQIGGHDSELRKTLLDHLGTESPLMKVLSPDESKGLLVALRQSLDAALEKQRDGLLRQFSLDNKEGALSRLVVELSDRQGQLSRDLKGKIDEVVKEFSLDEENSALSRLVRNVDAAQKTISDEFSLDNERSAFSRLDKMLRDTQGAIHKNLTLDEEGSPLARLKRELLTLLESHAKRTSQFQEEVKVALGSLMATRREAERSTRHGLQFEEAVCEMLDREAQRVGDVASATGATTGDIRNCKVGDAVIELGPESPAPGARLVVEAKEKEGYNLAAARAEIEQARKNRNATHGLFVFSRRTAPATLEPLTRLGHDVFVVWDAEDASTDLYLKAGLTVARALCLQGARTREASEADFDALQRAILEIEKRASGLEEVATSAGTIQSASEKILKRIRLTREALDKQVTILRETMADLQTALGERADSP